MIYLIPILFGLWSAYMVYIFIEKDDSFLQKRLKNTGKKYKTKTARIYNAFLDLLKPLSSETLKNLKFKNKIKHMLLRVGAPSSEDDILEFENKRLVLLLGTTLVCAAILVLKFDNLTLIAVLTMIFISYKYPEYRLQKIINKREKEFERYFADAIDLLAVCMEAGLGIDSAIERVGHEFKSFSNIVSREFLRISQDVASGISRQDALKNLTIRMQSKDLQSFTALLIQSEKLGTSIAQSLDVFCDTLRSRRKQRIEELVQSSSTKMTIPMVLFLLPALFIVILYPAVIQIMNNMSK